MGAQLWTAYAPCGSQHKDAVQITLEQIDLIKRMVEQYSSYLQLAQTAQGTEMYTAGKVNTVNSVTAKKVLGKKVSGKKS